MHSLSSRWFCTCPFLTSAINFSLDMWEGYKKVLSPLLVGSSLEYMHTLQSSEITVFLFLESLVTNV